MRCSACHHPNRPEARFCAECGARLGTEASADSGERRQLTVMFCDLADSTKLSEQLDPEDLRAVVREYHRACADVVRRYEGHVAEYLGDGVLANFGYPRAHELDVERGVRAGLAVVDAVRALNPRLERELRVRLAVRVGIHTGPVVVDEEHGETAAFGGAPNVAARLQGLAEPDSIVVSGATLRLVQGQFLTRDRGAHQLKGVERPVAVYQVLRPSGVRSRLDIAGPGGLTPFVGRSDEMEALARTWSAGLSDGGRAVLLGGDAGIGKSRVVAAFRERLADTQHTWLECRCSPYDVDSPFQPAIELQAAAIGFAPEDRAAEKLAKLERALERVGFALPEVVPLLAAAHSIPFAERYAAPTLSPEAARRKLVETLRDWLLRIAAQQPVVLLVDDLHWIDPSTLALLSAIVDGFAATPLLMLLTHRPDFVLPWPTGPRLAAMSIGRLDPPTATRLVENVAGRTLDRELVADIVRKADGVPLFLEEMTKAVLEASRDDDGAAHRVEVPATLKGLLMARLDRLRPAKEAAQLGATLGREVSHEMLAAGRPHDEESPGDALALLLGAGLLYQRGHGPGTIYVFKHALVQDTAYESLLKATRQRYHERIADVLAEHFPDVATTQPELLAHHYTEARRPERAVPYWQRAGQRGIERSANVEAIRHLRRGLDCLRTLPPGPERNQQELALQTLLGVNLIANRGYAADEVLANFARARELCQAVGETPAIFPVLFGLWVFHLVRADREATGELAGQLLRFAEAADDTSMLIEAHVANTLTSFWQGAHERARQHAAEVMARYSKEAHRGNVAIFGDDPGVYAYIYDGLALYFLGSPDRARRRLEEARALATEIGHPFTTTGAQAFSTQLLQFRRETDAVREAADETIAQSREQQFPLFVAVGIIHRGWATVRSGDVAAGTAAMRDGIAMFRATGARLNVHYFLSELAEAHLAAADRTQGLAAVDEALALTAEQLDLYYEAELHCLRGELLLLAPADVHGAEICFRRALAVSRSQSARALELRAPTSLARLLERRGQREDGRALVAPLYRGFREGLETEDLARARACLDEPERH